MASPWKELLDFYQIKENSRITYDQIIEQFQPAGLTPTQLLLTEPDTIPHLTGELVVSNLTVAEDDRHRILDAVSFTLRLDEHTAIIGQSGSGKSELALLLARLSHPTSGRITIYGHNLADLPIAVIGRRIGYLGANPYLFAGSLRDNLLLGLRHVPVRPAPTDAPGARRRAQQLQESRRSGEYRFRPACRLIDYEAGPESPMLTACRGASPNCLAASASRPMSTISGCAGASILRPTPGSPRACCGAAVPWRVG